MEFLFLVLGVAATIFFLCKRTLNVKPGTAILKCFSSVGFVFTALFGFVGNDACPDALGACIVAGAVLGLIGDYVLDLKYVYPQNSDTYLRTGFMSFLFGHLFYSIGLMLTLGLEIKNIIFAVCGAVLMGVFVPLSEKIMTVKYGKFMKITVIYLVVIGFTVALSFSYLFTDICKYTIVFNVAMVLFLLSDFLLAGLYFGTREKDRKNQVAVTFNHLFYYAAQYIIAVSVLIYEV